MPTSALADTHDDGREARATPGAAGPGADAPRGGEMTMAETLLKVSGLRVAYGGIQAVKGVDFEVRAGELVSLIGSNGAGKTTTMKAITGSLAMADGDIEYLGKSIKGQGPWDLEQQVLAMGRALMSRPKVLLMDEPSMGLSPIMVDKIFEVVRDVYAQGVTILLVEQNASRALAIANRGYVMESGIITMAGDAKEMLHDPRVRAAYLGE